MNYKGKTLIRIRDHAPKHETFLDCPQCGKSLKWVAGMDGLRNSPNGIGVLRCENCDDDYLAFDTDSLNFVSQVTLGG